ncbi:MAG: immunoglobulin-like domain-containing protein, partial [Candidatus Paceibacterota bacterium]
ITNKIVITGTVDTNTVGTYTLTYTVTDSGGLSASTTRQVVVSSSGGGGGQCLIPEITSPLTASVQVNLAFTYTLTASSTATTTLSVATSTLPAGLTYSNGVISGTPTAVGTYSITLEAGNSCGVKNKTLVLTVTDVPPPVCVGCGGGSGGGGGGGGGGNGPIIPSLSIFNEYVREIEPGVAMVTWNTNIPATRQVVYGNNSNPITGSAPLYGYTSNTEKIETPLATSHGMAILIDSSKVYYFRPISSDNGRIVIGKELTITRGTVTAPVTPGGSCYYLYDFLRKDFNNNPVEVRKLQVFLNTLEGFTSLQITGVYDDATVAAVDAFQNRYKADILTPWGHTAPTGYTYILTKKKVNEIYCQRAFPVTPLEQQEIDSFRAFLLGLKNANIQLDNGVATPPDNKIDVPIQNEIIGQNGGNTNGNVVGGNGTSTITTLAGVSSTTRSIVSRLTANVLEGGKSFLNLALGVFGWPLFGMNNNDSRIFNGEWKCKWLILSLVVLILAILYFWYREYKNNRKIEEINKEIDLEQK